MNDQMNNRQLPITIRPEGGIDSLASLYGRIGFLSRRMVQIADSFFDEAAQELGLTLPQYDILVALRRRGTMGQLALGQLVGIDPSNTAAIVRRLEAGGLVTRLPDPDDARRKLIGLTEMGERVEAKAARIANAISTRLLSPLSKDRQERLLGILAHVAGMEVNSVSLWLPDAEVGAREDLSALFTGPCFLFRRVNQVVLSKIRERNREESVTARQYIFLVAVREMPLVDQTTLTGILGLDRSTIALVADNLRKRKLIKRTADRRDRRKNLLSILPAGIEAAARVGLNNADLEAEMLADYPEGEREALRHMLRQLVAAHNRDVRTPIVLPEGFLDPVPA